MTDVARWSERAGCQGILVYTDNGLVDPWLVSDGIIRSTDRLIPLVAVQPVYMHPYTVAKMVASIAFLHERAVHLNILAGGFRNDLLAMGDETPHDERYERTVEYAHIAMGLLRGESVSVTGRYYTVTNLRMSPAVPADLVPDVLISGSSQAVLDAARRIGALAVRYPQRPGKDEDTSPEFGGGPIGVRIGIIARDDSAEAWRIAHQRFPDDRTGQITHRLAMSVSDSHWHRQLSAERATNDDNRVAEPDPYWLGPFQHYQTFCPYLVGSYERIGWMIAEYIRRGASTFILDIPPSEEEFAHVGTVFARAQELVT
ncbi:MAG: LLM class flavin-dependent oxidoreductase [Actinomycetia bacterium]|nr:LLM class flavin-dependent oxidoreductase [Actinomycetes bacterium]